MLKTKRWDEPAEPDDGTRILITRYRPRGLRKEDETWSEWRKNLGPSAELLAAYNGKNGMSIGWMQYRNQYLREMIPQAAEIKALAQRVASGESITLLCSAQCLREARCHRSLLKTLIETEMARMTAGH